MTNATVRILSVGIGQMHIIPGDDELNIHNAIGLVERAGAEGCDIIVLPECLDLGWTDLSATTKAESIPGPRSELLAEAAMANSIHVVAGLTEKAEGAVYNTAILLDDGGDLLARHRKINILDIAQHIYQRGQDIGIVNTQLGRVGINICADLLPEYQDVGFAQAAIGAEIILSPCSWAVPPDFDQKKTPYGQEWMASYGAIAAKYSIPVVGVSNTGCVRSGAWSGWQCIGSSLVVHASGKVYQCPYSDTDHQLYYVQVAIGQD
ncbi:MAG: carbon-nitrogen hydrolase family protein [Saprospiraceae bacterium]|nr:carbon-nitrogen hydrolase family protein [Saprospiraceae bacterium]